MKSSHGEMASIKNSWKSLDCEIIEHWINQMEMSFIRKISIRSDPNFAKHLINQKIKLIIFDMWRIRVQNQYKDQCARSFGHRSTHERVKKCSRSCCPCGSTGCSTEPGVERAAGSVFFGSLFNSCCCCVLALPFATRILLESLLFAIYTQDLGPYLWHQSLTSKSNSSILPF